MASLKTKMRRAGFKIEGLGGNVTGYVRSVRGGEIIIQETGAGRAPSRLSDGVCAYWFKSNTDEPIKEVCGDIDDVLRAARKRR